MKSLSSLLRGALGLLPALVLLAPAPPAAAYDDEGVTLYKDVHFTGRSETFYGDVADLRGTYVGNDRASSLAVPRGCRVTLYRHAGFRGPAITVHHDVADLGATRVGNDEVSSLRLDCYGGGFRGGGYRGGGYHGGYGHSGYRHGDYRGGRHGAVTVFADADFRGRSESFRYDDPDLRDNYIRQDAVSSVLVAPGCRAVLFADVGFRGAATVVTAGENNLGYTAVGNDRVSSIQVDCRRHR